MQTININQMKYDKQMKLNEIKVNAMQNKSNENLINTVKLDTSVKAQSMLARGQA